MRWDGFGFDTIELSRVVDAPITPLMVMLMRITTSAPAERVVGVILLRKPRCSLTKYRGGRLPTPCLANIPQNNKPRTVNPTGV